MSDMESNLTSLLFTFLKCMKLILKMVIKCVNSLMFLTLSQRRFTIRRTKSVLFLRDKDFRLEFDKKVKESFSRVEKVRE